MMFLSFFLMPYAKSGLNRTCIFIFTPAGQEFQFSLYLDETCTGGFFDFQQRFSYLISLFSF